MHFTLSSLTYRRHKYLGFGSLIITSPIRVWVPHHHHSWISKLGPNYTFPAAIFFGHNFNASVLRLILCSLRRRTCCSDLLAIVLVACGGMDRPLSLIRDITPATPQPWTVKVMVVEKSHVREARASLTKFQRLVLKDSEEMRVQLTLFNENINIYRGRLELFGSYYISNASVSLVPAKYPFEGSPYQWSLNYRFLVEKVADEAFMPPMEHTFVDVASLSGQYMTLASVDMLLVVLKVLPRRNLSARAGGTVFQEMIVVDRSLKPVVLTIWDRFVDFEAADISAIVDQKPVIAALRLKVSAYDGLSLSTKSVTSFQVNPVIGPAIALQSWLADNIVDVNELLASPQLELLARNFGKEVTSELRQISYVHHHPSVKFFYARCRLRLVDMDQEIVRYYCSDSTCNASTTALPGSVYTCNLCSKEVICTTGIRVNASAEDLSGTLAVTLYACDAAVFLGYGDVSTVLDKIKGVKRPLQMLKKNGNNKEFTVRLKSQGYTYMGVPSRRFVASFPTESDAENEVSAVPVSLSAADTSRLLGALQTTAVQETLDVSPQEKEMLEGIFARQRLKGKSAESLVSGLSVGYSGSSAETAIEADGESHASPKISNLAPTMPKDNADSIVPLEDEEEWQMLLKGSSSAVQSQAPTPVKKTYNHELCGSRVTIKQEGKDRAPEVEKESLKVMRKLFQD